jgi:hypothetical protein
MMGLVRGEGFAIDARVIKADANRTRGLPAAEWSSPEQAGIILDVEAEAHRTNRASGRVADCATKTLDFVAVPLFFVAELQHFDLHR